MLGLEVATHFLERFVADDLVDLVGLDGFLNLLVRLIRDSELELSSDFVEVDNDWGTADEESCSFFFVHSFDNDAFFDDRFYEENLR